MEVESKGKWSMQNCVKWSQFVITLVTILGIQAGLFTYMMDNHEKQPHEDAARKTQITEMKADIKDTSEKMADTREKVAAIDVKIDSLQKGIDEVKKLVR